MARADLIASIVRANLSAFARARDLEENRNAVCFEDGVGQRLARFELGRPKDHVWLILIHYRVRPTLRTVLDRGMPQKDFESTAIGPLPLRNRHDWDRLSRILCHYSANSSLVDFADPFLEQFLGALRMDDSDRSLAKQTLRQLISDAVLALRGDVSKSELTLPIGTLAVRQHESYFSHLGRVPPYAHLVLDPGRKGSSSSWLDARTTSFIEGVYVSAKARNVLLDEIFEEAERVLCSGATWRVAQSTEDGDHTIHLQRVEGSDLVLPSKAYVLYLNRGHNAFADLIRNAAGDTWRSIYEGNAIVEDALSVLEQRLLTYPDQFESYSELAEFHEARGNLAMSNLMLGLGYLRSRKLPGIAQGKLKLAAEADPNCPGLAAALAELASFTRSN